jgi:hypothetical protein
MCGSRIVYAFVACSRRQAGKYRGWAMDWKTMAWTAVLCGQLVAAPAGVAAAQTLDEDEARIEQIMHAPVAEPAPAIASTAPVDDSVKETPVVAAVVAPAQTANDEWLAPTQHDEGMAFAELAKSIGRRVSITTTQSREHVGVITSADSKQVTLQVTRKGGSAAYTLLREQIEHIESR